MELSTRSLLLPTFLATARQSSPATVAVRSIRHVIITFGAKGPLRACFEPPPRSKLHVDMRFSTCSMSAAFRLAVRCGHEGREARCSPHGGNRARLVGDSMSMLSSKLASAALASRLGKTSATLGPALRWTRCRWRRFSEGSGFRMMRGGWTRSAGAEGG